MSRIRDAIRALMGKAVTTPQDYYGPTVTIGDQTSTRTLYTLNHELDQLLKMIDGDAANCRRIVSTVAANQRLRLYRRAGRTRTASLSVGRRKALLRAATGHKAGLELFDSNAEVEEVPTHPILDLLADPNPHERGSYFATARFADRCAVGNSFILVQTGGDGLPENLFRLYPNYTRVVVDKDELVAGYRYGRDTTDYRLYEPSDVIHMRWMPSPTNPYYGEGAQHAVVREQQTLLAMGDAMRTRYLQGGIPQLQIIEDAAVTLSDVNRKAMHKTITDRLMNPRMAARPLFLKGAEAKAIGMRPRDAEEVELRRSLVEAIWRAYGVPEAIVSLNDANLASATESNPTFMRLTIAPLLRGDAEDLTNELLPYYDLDPADWVLVYDDPTPEDTEADQTRLILATQSGLMTLNEARRELGMDDYDDDAADKPTINGQPLGGFAATVPGAAGLDSPPPRPALPAGNDDPDDDDGGNVQIDPVFRLSLAAANDPWALHAKAHACCDGHGQKMAGVDGDSAAIEPIARVVQDWYEQVTASELGRGVLTPDYERYAGLLEQRLTEPLIEALMAGYREAASEVGIEAFEQRPEAALTYARQTAPLIAQTASESATEAVRAAVDAGLERGMSSGAIARELRETMPEVSASRAETIARTETAEARVQGSLAAWREGGRTHKQWLVAGGPCPICEAVGARYPGPIPIGDAFFEVGDSITGTDGKSFTFGFRRVMGPPAHPNCRCALVSSEEGGAT